MSSLRQYIHVGSAMFYKGGARSLSEWETAVKQLLDKGQFFLAYDPREDGARPLPGKPEIEAICRAGAVPNGWNRGSKADS